MSVGTIYFQEQDPDDEGRQLPIKLTSRTTAKEERSLTKRRRKAALLKVIIYHDKLFLINILM